MGDVTPPGGDEELRAKYSADQLKAMAKNGEAMPDGSYPVKDTEDLQPAIHAVGRGGASHDAIRKHIIDRAKALGASDQIPDTWNADGSLKQSNSRARKRRHRAVPLLPEVRHWATTGLEIRSRADTDEIVITGAPIVYDTPYVVRDMFGDFEETMSRGVAQTVLANGADVRLLFNHDGLPLARSTSGTLTLRDTDRALEFEARLDARQQLANDLAVAIERGDVSQMSCGFVVARDEWDDDEEHRTVHELAELLDVSAVTYPASPSTSIQIARRMALEVPVESRARLRRIYAQLRAGKVLSQDNQDKLVAAAHAIHAILDSAGFDPATLLTEDESESTDRDGMQNVDTLDDGTIDGEMSGTEESLGPLDATVTRSATPKLQHLRLQAQARRSRRIAA